MNKTMNKTRKSMHNAGRLVVFATVLCCLAPTFGAAGSGDGSLSGESSSGLATCGLPPRPWLFLNATSQIEPTPGSGFRAANEADYDNDGDLDVVIVQNVTGAGVVGSPERGVLYMNEDGRFVDRTADYLPELLVPEVRWWVSPHDYFGGGPDGAPDGLVDLFIPGGQGEPSRLFRNRGFDDRGTPRVWLGFIDESWRIQGPTATATHCYHSHKGDFDGDGRMDMLVYQFRPDLGFGQDRLLMNRDGYFVDETNERLPLLEEPAIFGHAEDLNGDGWIDYSYLNLKNGLVPGNYSGVPTIRVRINDGTGHFPDELAQIMPERINPSSGLGTYSLDHGDYDGDGKLDIYVINWGMPGNDVRDGVLLNHGQGNQLFTEVAYPIFPDSGADNDGDHPVSKDLNGDGKVDVVVAQFASRPFFLINESCNGEMVLREQTPPEVPSANGFRAKVFDANGDGVQDVWLAMRFQNYLLIGNKPEEEPNNTIAQANPTTFPALRTGALASTIDQDIFVLSGRSWTEGSRVRVRPAVDADPRLVLLDKDGAIVAVSEVPGVGSIEELEIPVGSEVRFVRLELQDTLGSGSYQLEIEPLTVQQGGATIGSPESGGGNFPTTRGSL